MKCMMKILLLVTAPVVIPSLATPGQTECQRQPHMCNMNQPLVALRNEEAQVHVHSAARERHAACKLSQSCWRPARRGGRKSCTGGRKSCTASFTFHDLQEMGSWASWRNTCDNHNYNLYQIVCASVYFPGTFVASTNFYVRNIGLLWVL